MSEFNKFADLMIEAAYQENIKNLGKPMAELMKQSVIQLKPVIEIFFNKGMEIGKAQAVPEGFVLVKDKPVAYMVQNKFWNGEFEVKLLSEMPEPEFEGDSYDIEIPLYAIEAQEPTND